MNQTLLLDSIVFLDRYVTLAQQRQQAGQPVDESLLRQAQVMLHRLSIIAATQTDPMPESHK
jgi:hypothetical protein